MRGSVPSGRRFRPAASAIGPAAGVVARAGAVLVAGLVLACAAALTASPALADGVDLRIDLDGATSELVLDWTGGAPPYDVYRSTDAATLSDPSNLVATASAAPARLPLGAPMLEFFSVAGATSIDTASPVTTTGACLTAATGAQAAVVVELLDGGGQPVTGATVTIDASAGDVGPVVEDAGIYRATVTAPSAPAAPIQISVTADGLPLTMQPTIEVAAPFSGPGVGAGGCPLDGNLRVRVVDPTGTPLPGARVLVGDQEALAVFETTPGAPADGDSTATADGSGVVEFRDFGDVLAGPHSVTAAADGRRYATIVDIDAADVVLALAPLDPGIATGLLTGALAPIPAPNNDPIELGVMLPDVGLDALLSFSIDDLIADDECYVAGGLAGQAPAPSNVYIPGQCAVFLFGCLQSLPAKPYTSAPIALGPHRLLALRGSTPLSTLTGGGDLTSAVTFNGIGALDATVSGPGPTTQDLPITATLNANLSCEVDGVPLNADVLCLAGGDWDSATDPSLPPGAGRLFVMGYRVGDAATATPLTISGVTTVADSGDFANIDYLGGAIAQYLDPLKPGIPPGTVDGSSIILDRSGTSFDGGGGTLVLDDFFPIRTLSRLGRELSLEPLPGTGHPSADLTLVSIVRRISETYTACDPGDSVRTSDEPLWDVIVAGGRDAITLPTPPPDWPRAGLGGDLAGLVDPAATPEDDALLWEASTLHLGTLPGAFDFDALHLIDVTLHATHVTRNETAY